MFSLNWRDGEECITPSLSIKLFHPSGSSRSCYSTFSVWISNGQWLCHAKGGSLTGFSDRPPDPGHHHHFTPKDRNGVVLARPPLPAMEETVAPAGRSYRNVLCAGLHSQGSACEGKASPLPDHQLLFHHMELKIRNGSRLGKAQSCLRLDAQFPVSQSSSSYKYCTQFCFREHFQLLFHSAQMTREGN